MTAGSYTGYDNTEIKNVLFKRNQTEEGLERTLKIAELLKDADALDRERFIGNGALNIGMLHSKSAKNINMQLFAYSLNNLFAKKNVCRNTGEDIKDQNKNYIKELENMRIQGVISESETVTLNEIYEVLGELGINKRGSLTAMYETYGLNYLEVESAADLLVLANKGKDEQQFRQNGAGANKIEDL